MTGRGVETDVAILVRELGTMIDAARKQVSVAANAALTDLYWQVGHHVRTEVLEGRRAIYGAQIVAAVSRQLENRFGRGFGEKNIRRMVQFATAFPDGKIVAALRRQLTWGHFKLLIPMKDPLKRDFYAEMCRVEGWFVVVIVVLVHPHSVAALGVEKPRAFSVTILEGHLHELQIDRDLPSHEPILRPPHRDRDRQTAI